jgi:hypothetical protein
MKLKKLRMQFLHIEEYIIKFKNLCRQAGYTQGSKETINLFLGGLPGKVLADVLKPPFVNTYDNIKTRAVQSTQSCILLDAILGGQQDSGSTYNSGMRGN